MVTMYLVGEIVKSIKRKSVCVCGGGRQTHIRMINGKIHRWRRFILKNFLKMHEHFNTMQISCVGFFFSPYVNLIHAPFFWCIFITNFRLVSFNTTYHISAINWSDFHSVTQFTWRLSVFKTNIFWTVKKKKFIFLIFSVETFGLSCIRAIFTLTVIWNIFYYILKDYKSK